MKNKESNKRQGRLITLYAFIAIVFITCFQAYWLYSEYTSREKLIHEESENFLKQYVLSYDSYALAQKLQSSQSLPKEISEQLFNGYPNMNVQVQVIGVGNDKVTDVEAKKIMDSLFSSRTPKNAEKEIFKELKQNIKKKYPGLKFSVKDYNGVNKFSFPDSLTVPLTNHNLTLASKFNPFQSATLKLYNVHDVVFRQMLWPLLLSLLYFVICAGAVIMLISNIRKSRRLMEMKDNFTNNMTHELKTPLAALQAATEALDKYNVMEDKDTAREYVRLMQADVKRLTGMAESILYNAKLSDGKVYLNTKPVNLKDIVEEVVSKFRLLAQRQEAIIDITGIPETLHVMADEEHLGNVFSNLIDNSLKYSMAKPIIKIDAMLQEGKVVKMLFSDNGIGIADKHQKEVFKPYFRIGEGDRHNVKGYGLGLSYAYEIIMLHKGSIKVLKSEQGKGSTFELTIPAVNE